PRMLGLADVIQEPISSGGALVIDVDQQGAGRFVVGCLTPYADEVRSAETARDRSVGRMVVRKRTAPFSSGGGLVGGLHVPLAERDEVDVGLRLKGSHEGPPHVFEDPRGFLRGTCMP